MFETGGYGRRGRFEFNVGRSQYKGNTNWSTIRVGFADYRHNNRDLARDWAICCWEGKLGSLGEGIIYMGHAIPSDMRLTQAMGVMGGPRKVINPPRWSRKSPWPPVILRFLQDLMPTKRRYRLSSQDNAALVWGVWESTSTFQLTLRLRLRQSMLPSALALESCLKI